MKLIFDTGSDWLCVESVNCANCLGKNYNEGKSEVHATIQEDLTTREYGSALLKGTEVFDRVCLSDSEDFCLPMFEWFIIYEQTGIRSEIDGVMGLSRSGWTDSTTGRETGPIFTYQLADEGVLESRVFAINIVSYKSDKNSFIDFGDYDPNAF